MPKKQRSGGIYESLGQAFPKHLSAITTIEDGLGLETQYAELLGQAEEFWSHLKADIEKKEKEIGDSSPDVDKAVRFWARTFLRETYVYYDNLGLLDWDTPESVDHNRIIAFRNIFEHGIKKMPLIYVREGREGSPFGWALGIDLAVIPQRLANSVLRLYGSNIDVVFDLVEQKIRYFNLSLAIEMSVRATIKDHSHVSEHYESAVPEMQAIEDMEQDLVEYGDEEILKIFEHYVDEAREYWLLLEYNKSNSERIEAMLKVPNGSEQ